MSHECLECDEQDIEQLFQCKQCKAYFCKGCWGGVLFHSPKYKLAKEHEPVPLQDLRGIFEADQDVFARMNKEENKDLHKLDAYSYWFDINTKEGKAGINSDLYAEIILRSNFEDKAKQFPSIVSFVGNTGAGKSTIIVSDSPLLLAAQNSHSYEERACEPGSRV